MILCAKTSNVEMATSPTPFVADLCTLFYGIARQMRWRAGRERHNVESDDDEGG